MPDDSTTTPCALTQPGDAVVPVSLALQLTYLVARWQRCPLCSTEALATCMCPRQGRCDGTCSWEDFAKASAASTDVMRGSGYTFVPAHVRKNTCKCTNDLRQQSPMLQQDAASVRE